MGKINDKVFKIGCYGSTIIGNLFGKKTYYKSPTGLDLNHICIRPEKTMLELDNLYSGIDFLPDYYSECGEPFAQSACLEFAQYYVSNKQFDIKNCRYFQRSYRSFDALQFHPSAKTEQHLRAFVYLIHRIEEYGYSPDLDGRVVLVNRKFGGFYVISGSQTLAAILALKIKEAEVIHAFENEIKAYFYDLKKYCIPVGLFKKNLMAIRSIGNVKEQMIQKAFQLKKHIRNNPLVRFGDIYQPIPFSEFSGLKTQANDEASYRRLSMILNAIPNPENKTFLDLGCNVGFYLFSLAKRGAKVVGVDIDNKFIDISRMVSNIFNVKVKLYCSELSPEMFSDKGCLVNYKNTTFDLISCFSVLQWVINNKGVKFGMETLRVMAEHCKMMIIDIPVNFGGVHLNSPPGEEVVCLDNFITNSCKDKQCTYLGSVAPYGVDFRNVFLVQ